MATYDVGIVGIGALGEAFGERFLETGSKIIVYNRSTPAVERLQERGAAAATSLEDLAKHASVIITVLPEGKDVRAVFEGPSGLLQLAHPGTLLIDCSTVEPELSRSLASLAKERGLRFSDAGVGGVPSVARAGRVSFIYGAFPENKADVEKALQPLAGAFYHCGPPGSGMTAKLINNLVSTAIHVADLEAVVLAERAGLDVGVFLEVLQSTLADNRQLRDRIPAELVEREHAPGFKLDLAYKDAVIARALAEELGVPLVTLASGCQVLSEARELGYGSRSVSALLPTVRHRVESAGS